MKQKDQGFKAHLAAIKQISTLRIQVGAVGMHTAEPGQKQMSNADIMRIHEIGVPSRNIPARMPVRKGLHENIAYFSRLTQNLLKKNFNKNGIDIQKFGQGIGVAMKNVVQATIMSRLSPKLSEKYEERKTAQGFSDIPLIKTGQLKNSIDYGIKR